MKRAISAVALGLFVAAAPGACSAGSSQAPAPVCRKFQFRACKDPCGRGVQQCLASGEGWGPCNCVVTDASLGADAALQGDASDATPDADALQGDAGDAAPDADAANDAGLVD